MVNGIIGKKLGMTQFFKEDGKMEAVTAIEAGPCGVAQIKTPAKEGYAAIQLAFGETKRISSPQKGHLKGLPPTKYLREFKIGESEKIEVGAKVDVSQFKAGDKVTIIGTSKGKGFAGVVKRYHFKGGPKTHGQSDRHRAPGSIGATTSPGRVLKGKKMAGRMGGERVTERNLVVVQVDAGRNLLLVRGAVPGAKNGLLLISKSGKVK
ncbi:MAG: 50S ribosomal protein L3 [Chloroflexota bacterium]